MQVNKLKKTNWHIYCTYNFANSIGGYLMLKKFLLVLLFLLAASAGLFAEADIADYDNAFDMIWLILCAVLVFFMQAGFAMVETGLTRAKNAGNILMKNLMDFAVGAIVYMAAGWAIMYGSSVAGFFGSDQFFLSGADFTVLRDWMFQVVFAATAATIVSGAMAERTRFSSYLIYTVFITAIIYPVAGHWIWNGDGWLAALGFHDFAGSTVVHSVGGWAALTGAFILGPRTGKYVRDGKSVTVQAIPGHNMPLASLGVFILWFGWYGFNCGSTLSGTDEAISLIAVNTTLGAAAGAVSSMAVIWGLTGKPEPSMTLNGALAGLVGITAGCAVVTPLGAIMIGLIAGALVVVSVEFIDKKMHVDDPVGAISVHGVCGVWGTIAVGIFGSTDAVKGLWYGGGFNQLMVQLTGITAVFIWTAAVSAVLFIILKKNAGLRVSPEDELKGLDLTEHGSESYYGFQIFTNQ